MKKPFDLQLYRENDDRAKAAVSQCLNDEGLYCHVNEDKYGPDLCVYTGYKHKYYIECEIKYAWKSGDLPFPYEKLQIPHRKAKFIDQPKPVEFWILSADAKAAIIVPDYVLETSEVVVVPNKLVSEGEKFFQVPVDQCIIRRLT